MNTEQYKHFYLKSPRAGFFLPEWRTPELVVHKFPNTPYKQFIPILKESSMTLKDPPMILKECTEIQKDPSLILKECIEIQKDPSLILKECTEIQKDPTMILKESTLLQTDPALPIKEPTKALLQTS
jgi:hypothetical protein